MKELWNAWFDYVKASQQVASDIAMLPFRMFSKKDDSEDEAKRMVEESQTPSVQLRVVGRKYPPRD